jgi:hypothetical protein
VEIVEIVVRHKKDESGSTHLTVLVNTTSVWCREVVNAYSCIAGVSNNKRVSFWIILLFQNDLALESNISVSDFAGGGC